MAYFPLFGSRRRREEVAAARWAVRLEENSLEVAEQAVLERWLAGDPGRRALLEDMQNLQLMMRRVGAEQASPVLAAPRRGATATVLRARRHPWPYWGLAGGVLAVLVVLVALNHNVVRTGYSQLRSVTLADGSRIDLNADSRVRIEESADERRVEILDGEAYFSVRHDPVRPFVVIADGQRITDVGTEFNVKARGDSMRVCVVQGAVDISAQAPLFGTAAPSAGHALNAGQLAVYRDRSFHTLKADDGRLQQELAWRERRLVVDDRPLAEVIDEINHYTPYKLILIGDDLRRRNIGGVFDLRHPDQVVALLIRTLNLQRTEVTPYVVLLRGRRAAG